MKDRGMTDRNSERFAEHEHKTDKFYLMILTSSILANNSKNVPGVNIFETRTTNRFVDVSNVSGIAKTAQKLWS